MRIPFYKRFRLTVTIQSLLRWEIIPVCCMWDRQQGWYEFEWLCLTVSLFDLAKPEQP